MALNRATRGYLSVRPAGRLGPSGLVKGWAVVGAAERLAAAGAESELTREVVRRMSRLRAGRGRRLGRSPG
jgi:hypothetical protein